ncbi:hypothetical protein AZ78_1259 [Lysobacter capsici AZ78]|uniref:Uncharacterized protein n=1 Tax=Lysobacter capsici AZ78 TaxID=1444315 RepID=A0A120AFX9_9GAMM|nr:hypothetical protein AZ78_1259 [Lysobacter capsici AZ78]
MGTRQEVNTRKAHLRRAGGAWVGRAPDSGGLRPWHAERRGERPCSGNSGARAGDQWRGLAQSGGLAGDSGAGRRWLRAWASLASRRASVEPGFKAAHKRLQAAR